jgi:hypothetical protein
MEGIGNAFGLFLVNYILRLINFILVKLDIDSYFHLKKGLE